MSHNTNSSSGQAKHCFKQRKPFPTFLITSDMPRCIMHRASCAMEARSRPPALPSIKQGPPLARSSVRHTFHSTSWFVNGGVRLSASYMLSTTHGCRMGEVTTADPCRGMHPVQLGGGKKRVVGRVGWRGPHGPLLGSHGRWRKVAVLFWKMAVRAFP